MVPQRRNRIIIMLVSQIASALYAKRIFRNIGVHAVASYVRFHSRHNRLKGDRRRPVSDLGRWKRFPHLENMRMLSRALSLATVTLLIGCLAAIPVRAQNLEAGKSPSQIFSGTCTACHKSPRGLLKTVPAGSLPGFLRQHYTTSSDMAKELSALPDLQWRGRHPRYRQQDGCEARSGLMVSRSRRPGPMLTGKRDPGRQGRNAKRPARPGRRPTPQNPPRRPGPGPRRDRPWSRRPQIGCQAEAEQEGQGRRRTAQEPMPPRTDDDRHKSEAAPRKNRQGERKDEASKRKPPRTEGSTPESSKPSRRQAVRDRQASRRQACRGQAVRRQVRDRQGRCAEGNGSGETPALRRRSGSAGHAGAEIHRRRHAAHSGTSTPAPEPLGTAPRGRLAGCGSPSGYGSAPPCRRSRPRDRPHRRSPNRSSQNRNFGRRTALDHF